MDVEHEVAASAAPLSRKSPLASRRWFRVRRRAQEILVALALMASAVAWVFLLDFHWSVVVAVVPALACTAAAAAFSRGLKAQVFVRAALWATFVIGCTVATTREPHAAGVELAAAATAGIVFLGRFARSLGGARPLFVAAVALALSDAVIHGLMAAFLVFEAVRHGAVGRDTGALAFFSFAACANAAGLFVLVRLRRVWPHIVGNAVIIALMLADVLELHGTILPFVIGGMALVQIGVAVGLKLPRMAGDARRGAEWLLRIAVIIALFVAAFAGPIPR